MVNTKLSSTYRSHKLHYIPTVQGTHLVLTALNSSSCHNWAVQWHQTTSSQTLFTSTANYRSLHLQKWWSITVSCKQWYEYLHNGFCHARVKDMWPLTMTLFSQRVLLCTPSVCKPHHQWQGWMGCHTRNQSSALPRYHWLRPHQSLQLLHTKQHPSQLLVNRTDSIINCSN